MEIGEILNDVGRQSCLEHAGGARPCSGFLEQAVLNLHSERTDLADTENRHDVSPSGLFDYESIMSPLRRFDGGRIRQGLGGPILGLRAALIPDLDHAPCGFGATAIGCVGHQVQESLTSDLRLRDYTPLFTSGLSLAFVKPPEFGVGLVQPTSSVVKGSVAPSLIGRWEEGARELWEFFGVAPDRFYPLNLHLCRLVLDAFFALKDLSDWRVHLQACIADLKQALYSALTHRSLPDIEKAEREVRKFREIRDLPQIALAEDKDRQRGIAVLTAASRGGTIRARTYEERDCKIYEAYQQLRTTGRRLKIAACAEIAANPHWYLVDGDNDSRRLTPRAVRSVIEKLERAR
jgi:hypothetical protein